MASKDIQSKTEKAIVFEYKAQSISAVGEVLGGTVDTAGFEALDFVMQGGLISVGLGSAGFKLILKESDTITNFVAVDVEFLITDNDEIDFNNQEISVGYIGKKRFVQVSIKRTQGAIGATIDSIGVSVIGGSPHHIPATPPSVTFP